MLPVAVSGAAQGMYQGSARGKLSSLSVSVVIWECNQEEVIGSAGAQDAVDQAPQSLSEIVRFVIAFPRNIPKGQVTAVLSMKSLLIVLFEILPLKS